MKTCGHEELEITVAGKYILCKKCFAKVERHNKLRFQKPHRNYKPLYNTYGIPADFQN